MVYRIYMVSGEVHEIESARTFEEIRNGIIKSEWISFSRDGRGTDELLVKTDHISSFVACNV